jgi:hypothetical protein
LSHCCACAFQNIMLNLPTTILPFDGPRCAQPRSSIKALTPWQAKHARTCSQATTRSALHALARPAISGRHTCSMMLGVRKVLVWAACTSAVGAVPHAPRTWLTCPDKWLNGTAYLMGGQVTAFATVASVGDCCDLCHGLYKDECVGWDWSGAMNGINVQVAPAPASPPPSSHNCAILSKLGPPMRAPRISGVVAGTPVPPPPPPPGPTGPPCRADLDCKPVTSTMWSCEETPRGIAPVAANNCHMHALTGNQTCACVALTCDSGAAAPSNVSAHTQYLSIGDSISLGLQPGLTALLQEDGWELTHSPGNAENTNVGAHCVASWTRADVRKYDVISYQARCACATSSL